MTSFTAKLRNGIWYFRKGYFNQSLYELKNGILNSPKASSLEWCSQLSVPESELYKEFGIDKRYVKKEFPEYYKFAQSGKNRCPVEMGKGSPMDLLYNLVYHLKPKYAVETGVTYGCSTLGILLGMKENPKSYLWSIDRPIPNLRKEKYVGCMVHDELKTNWSLLRMPDISGLPVVLNECQLIDFFHYDSDSSYRARLDSLKTVWHALRMGGHILCSDIQTNRAFRDFSEFTGRRPIVIAYGKRYFGLIRK